MNIVRGITCKSAGSLRAQSGLGWVTQQFEIGLLLFFVKIYVIIEIVLGQGHIVYAKGHLYIAIMLVCVDVHLFTIHSHYITCDSIPQETRKG